MRTARIATVGATAVVTLLALVVPAAAQQDDAEDRVLTLERVELGLERRIIPFDGRAEEVDGDEVTVTLDADVLFAFDQATLSPQAQQTLTQLAADLDDDLAGDRISVVGHTDSRGEPAYNLDLSERRAVAVRDLLAATLADPPTFDVTGRGEAEPVAPNETADGADDPEGRRRNRRVEVTYQAVAPEAPTEQPAPPS